MKKLIFVLGLLGLLFASTVCFATVEGTINIAGSTSMQPLVAELAQVFMSENAAVKINIAAGGSSAGVESVQNGTADIGMCSRDLKPEEAGLNETVIAKDGIAIVVNKSNSVSDLSLAQLQKIYTGEWNNWETVGGTNNKIYVVNREAGSGTRSALEEIILGKLTNTSHCLLEESNEAVQQAVAIIDEAIGYISLGSLDPTAVKTLSIESVSCTKEQILTGNYKVQRPFIMLTKTEPVGVVKAFLDWVLSAKGQAIIAGDFIPVTP